VSIPLKSSTIVVLLTESSVGMTTPLQIVKEKYGSKEKLVSQLITHLKPVNGESKDEFQKRLMTVSNRKLLKLMERQS
jgi:hypothetical protein